ncbi:MAG: hypothetical protein ACTSW7_04585 [Candidatus Thorarchaeota archaeon]
MEKYPHLSFRDWFTKRPYESENWLVVAQHMKNPSGEDLRTSCALASVGSGHLKKLTSGTNWEINRVGGDYFGATYFTRVGKEEIIYQSGQFVKIDGITFQPLVIHRNFENPSLDHLKVSQIFILYYNAFYVQSEGIYQRINEKGNPETVVKIVNPTEDETIILMNTHLLRNYLAANKSYLVRYHDHRRSQADEIPDAELQTFMIRSSHSCFTLTLYESSMPDKFKARSIIIGKDIIEPYPEPDDERWHYLKDEIERRFVRFIIDYDEHGKQREEICDERELNSNFKDRGRPHFLTPVYFSREVLVKYINQPLWKSLGIPYNQTSEGTVMVWLGDLGRISYEEQMYWRSFNIAPSESVPDEVFMRDKMGVLIEPKGNAIYNFRKAFKLLQKKSMNKLHESLFKPLRNRDEHIEKWIRLPIVDTPREFDDIILGFAKLTNDSLNVKLLSKLTGKKINREEGISGSIDLLSVYLDVLAVDNEKKEKILFGLRMIQNLRSTGAAHRSGDNFVKEMKRHKLERLTEIKAIEKVVNQLTNSLLQLSVVVDSVT